MITKINLFKTVSKLQANITSLKILLGLFALFASSQISIPIGSVPITFLTVMVCLISLTYTPILSLITVGAYIFLGICGLPLFSKLNGGLNYFMGYTGGYLVGSFIATLVMSVLATKSDKNIFSIASIYFVGHLIIYFFGILWLAQFMNFNQAIYSGFVIFIPSGSIKLVIFSCLYKYVNNYKILR